MCRLAVCGSCSGQFVGTSQGRPAAPRVSSTLHVRIVIVLLCCRFCVRTLLAQGPSRRVRIHICARVLPWLLAPRTRVATEHRCPRRFAAFRARAFGMCPSSRRRARGRTRGSKICRRPPEEGGHCVAAAPGRGGVGQRRGCGGGGRPLHSGHGAAASVSARELLRVARVCRASAPTGRPVSIQPAER